MNRWKTDRKCERYLPWKCDGAHRSRKSINTIAWKLYEELTPQVGLSYLENMHFSRLDAADYVPATALGGFTNGVSPLEMAAGYAALANDGMYREPTCIMRITDDTGAEVYLAAQEGQEVYRQNAARMMTDVLKGVFINGTGRGLGLSDMPCAGKTGTTNDHKDGWLVGYTRYYTTSVWVGYDMPKEMDSLMGNTYPGKSGRHLWSRRMRDWNGWIFCPIRRFRMLLPGRWKQRMQRRMREMHRGKRRRRMETHRRRM